MLTDRVPPGMDEKFIGGIPYFYDKTISLWKSKQLFKIEFTLPCKNIIGKRYLYHINIPSNLNPYRVITKILVTKSIIKTASNGNCIFQLFSDSTNIYQLYLLDEDFKTNEVDIIIFENSELMFLVNSLNKVNFINLYLFYHYCY